VNIIMKQSIKYGLQMIGFLMIWGLICYLTNKLIDWSFVTFIALSLGFCYLIGVTEEK